MLLNYRPLLRPTPARPAYAVFAATRDELPSLNEQDMWLRLRQSDEQQGIPPWARRESWGTH